MMILMVSRGIVFFFKSGFTKKRLGNYCNLLRIVWGFNIWSKVPKIFSSGVILPMGRAAVCFVKDLPSGYLT